MMQVWVGGVWNILLQSVFSWKFHMNMDKKQHKMNLIKDDIFNTPQFKVGQPYYVGFFFLILNIFHFIFLTFLDLKAQTAKTLIEHIAPAS